MWAEGDEPFKSKHFDAERLLNVPQVLQRPRPLIMVGGGGEKKTLKLVAKYADACNLFNSPELEHKLDVLKQHCENEGRDYDSITKTVYHILDIGEKGEKTGELLEELERLSGLGIQVALGMVPHVHDPAVLERFAADVIPAAEKL
jgi:alkanesulfonate monooxygenase SsuD/methylene tetrahydromethanopterin reductase-like flavin-dependent oxidoreductase (luciferase family)